MLRKNIIKMNKLNNIKYSFVFTPILNNLNLNIPANSESHVNLAFGIFILSLICLLNFINVVSYLTSLYLINKYDVETKFPKLKKIIKYFERSSLFFFLLEGVTCLFFLLCIVIISLIEILIGGNNIFNHTNNESMGILFIIKKIKDIMPDWLKLALFILTVTYIILKLLGYSFLNIFTDDVVNKYFIIIYSLVMINYHLLNLYLIHKFSTKNIKIPEVLPNFLKNWLKEFYIMSSTKKNIKTFSKNSYIEISIYFTALLFALLFI